MITPRDINDHGRQNDLLVLNIGIIQRQEEHIRAKDAQEA